MSEQVNHPSHYNREGRKECIDEFVDKYGTGLTALWCVMTADKYLYRAGAKDGNSEDQDLKKAMWYMQWAKDHCDLKTYGVQDLYYAVSDKLLKRIQSYYDPQQ